MRKTRYLAVLSVCLLLLTSCTNKNPVEDESYNKHTPVESQEMYTYSKQLASATVNYFLGKEYEEAYTGILFGQPKIITEGKELQLEKEAGQITGEYLLRSALYARAIDLTAEYGGDLEELTSDYDRVIVGILDRHFFREGKVPSMTKVDTEQRITEEYTTWFLETAKSEGLLDKRVKFIYPATLIVNTNDAGPSTGGNSFNVFGVAYTVPEEDIGITATEIATSPLYDLEETSYRFYDTGYYTATYETKPSNATNQKFSITVTFKYTAPTTGEYTDALEKFIAGITDLQIEYQGVK